MRWPSNKTLGRIAVYVGVASISGVMFMRYKIEDRIRNTDYFRLALKTLRQHRGAVSLLGEPIRDVGFDIGDPKNRCDGETAQFEVKVKGPKDRGTMFFWASRDPEQGWLLNRLELEVKAHPEKRFLLRKATEVGTEPE